LDFIGLGAWSFGVLMFWNFEFGSVGALNYYFLRKKKTKSFMTLGTLKSLGVRVIGN